MGGNMILYWNDQFPDRIGDEPAKRDTSRDKVEGEDKDD